MPQLLKETVKNLNCIENSQDEKKMKFYFETSTARKIAFTSSLKETSTTINTDQKIAVEQNSKKEHMIMTNIDKDEGLSVDFTGSLDDST